MSRSEPEKRSICNCKIKIRSAALGDQIEAYGRKGDGFKLGFNS
jgi:hypothetical protein